MNTFWRVVQYEYYRNVFKKSFLFALFSVPFFIAFSIGMGFFINSLDSNTSPVGYVDHAGILDAPIKADQISIEYGKPVEFVAYESDDAARSALEAQDIQAYYVLPTDYFETRRVELVFIDRPGGNIERQFNDFVKINLLSAQPLDITFRLVDGTGMTIRSMDGRRVLPANGVPMGVLLPLFILMAFIFMIMMSSGYTVSAVADEKENRTMEVLVTSISPGRLIAGKIVGIVGIGLTLLATWTLMIILCIVVARQFNVDWFDTMVVDWRIVVATIIVAIPSYALAISLMTAIGAMVTTVQEGQSVSGLFFALFMVPLYVGWALFEDPHGSLSVTLSLLPFTALVAMGMRNLFSIVPGWQIAASALIQALCALGGLWLAGRALQLGLLLYGQRLSLRKLFRSGR